ncbi:uncharacterized protein [Blastocystis hominis]|uniref:RRM domain-containing protein n=1 Tax=Blastocystis hominis TaxID=12968 RepID=D8LVB4_BLAHO|nr:uncharacterized protein [Blastocystis hominis]CBK19753.2 unnamed protein product [Blastocystis hominis]|eukprot:XP_012893801.1 uncharacterized protein [Blastocystis hominis]
MSTEEKPLNKLFVGGLSFKTTDQSLLNYFSQFGEVKQANVMKYTDRQVSRGFGFCIFENSCSAELAMKTKNHIIDGREVDVRWALPKEMAPPPQSSSEQSPKNCVRKLFIGRLSLDVTERTLSAF